ncbi:helix-turn-helix domain-containing protein [Shewanella woodyi]|uniref:helix-turn-helix domain-containing protein n=1 Tax=Shewanella woodyi TaxID=60961 RepID=UPI003749CDC6
MESSVLGNLLREVEIELALKKMHSEIEHYIKVHHNEKVIYIAENLLCDCVRTSSNHDMYPAIQYVVINELLKEVLLNKTTSDESQSHVGECMSTIELTQRQHEILHWVKLGKSNWEISTILSISIDTVKFHLRGIYKRLGVSNRVQAVQVVTASDLESLDLGSLVNILKATS